jgi:putative SOS response-associated peptidase YedK
LVRATRDVVPIKRLQAKTPPRYNIAPSQDVPAVVQNRETGAREFRPFRWGLVPYWAKDPAIGNGMINARSETAANNPPSASSRTCPLVTKRRT